MTRKPVKDAFGGTVYIDEETGLYYEEDEPVDPDARRVCTALTEPLPSNPNRDPGDPWSIEDSKWPWLREVKISEKK